MVSLSDQEKFLQYDYGETKDLLKTFITLISGTLVLALTFSGRSLGPVAPTLFITALIAAGLSMAFIAAAAGKVLYGQIPLVRADFWRLALRSWSLVLLAGAAYVAGLIALAIDTVG